MSEGRDDGSIAPRRTLNGPILPPPPAQLADEARRAEESRIAAETARAEKERAKAASEAEQKRQAVKKAREREIRQREAEQRKVDQRTQRSGSRAAGPAEPASPSGAATATRSAGAEKRPSRASGRKPTTRRAQLRLVQVDAWSVMKTSFLLSIALGIVLVVAVAIIWAVLGASGVWQSINSIVQQAVGNESSDPFDITEYVGTSRILGFTMIVAVVDVILITAIATLGAFLYNLSAALLGGIEVTLAEDN